MYTVKNSAEFISDVRSIDERLKNIRLSSIEIERDEIERHEYEVAYEDMCYAVADACTKAIKKHGLWGYYHSIYYPDMNLRYLLFLKSVALKNFEARKLTFYEEKGQGEKIFFFFFIS